MHLSYAMACDWSLRNILEDTILNVKMQGRVVLLPWIPMISLDSPISFRRLQYPFRLTFAKAINEAQVQTMFICDLDVQNPFFSRAHLYQR